MSNMSAATVIHDEHHQGLEVMLQHDLGDHIRVSLYDQHDILQNPDLSIWMKRIDEAWTRVAELISTQGRKRLSIVNARRRTVLDHQNRNLETELPMEGNSFERVVSPLVWSLVFTIRLVSLTFLTSDEYEPAAFS
jgi:hypothetical protein